MSMEDLLNTPIELNLGELKLTVYRLSDADITALDLWVRSQVLAIAEQSITDDTPANRQVVIRDAALSKAMRTSWLTGDGRQFMASPEGLARILYQACRCKVPHAEIKKHLYSPANLMAVRETIQQLQPKVPDSVQSGKPEAAAPRPGQARRKKKKLKKS